MTNETQAGIVKPIDTLTPSAHYQFWIPGNQGAESGDALDQSGNGKDAGLDDNTIDLADISISSWTDASPAVFTVATHGLSVGDWVYITGTGLGTLDNKSFRVNTAPSATTLTLMGYDGTVLNTPGATGTGTMARGLWSDPAWMSFRGQTLANSTVTVPFADYRWDMALGQSLLVHFRIKEFDDATADAIIGSYRTNSSSDAGFRILVEQASGGILVGVQGLTNNELSSGTYEGGDLTDGAEHTITVAIDGSLKSTDVYFDGVIVIDDFDISSITSSTQSAAQGFHIGADASGGIPPSAKMRDVHCLVWEGGMPSNIQSVVNYLHSIPFTPLTEDVFNP